MTQEQSTLCKSYSNTRLPFFRRKVQRGHTVINVPFDLKGVLFVTTYIYISEGFKNGGPVSRYALITEGILPCHSMCGVNKKGQEIASTWKPITSNAWWCLHMNAIYLEGVKQHIQHCRYGVITIQSLYSYTERMNISFILSVLFVQFLISH